MAFIAIKAADKDNKLRNLLLLVLDNLRPVLPPKAFSTLERTEEVTFEEARRYLECNAERILADGSNWFYAITDPSVKDN